VGWRRAAGAAVVALVAACTAPKPPSTFEQEYEERLKSWEEMQTQLPAAQPKDADLIPVAVSGGTTYQFLIDQTSLTIGTDDVFRYTLVARSPEGARNVTYEGIRCETREKKLYATGRNDGTWSRARNSAWSPIEEVGNNRQQAALMKEYFCPDGTSSTTIPAIIERIRKRPNSII
jgi:CNP1-like family